MKTLGQVLWALLRLLLFVLTGEWFGGKPGEDDPAKAAQPGSRAQPGPRALSSEERGRLRGWLDAARARSKGLRAAALETRGGSTIALAVDDGIAPELARTQLQVEAPQSPRDLEQRVQALDDALGSLEGALEARRAEPGKGLPAADTERVFAEAILPLYEHLRAQPNAPPERIVIAVPRDRGRVHQRAAQHTRLLFVRAVQREPMRLGHGLRTLLRAVVDDLDSLVPALRAAHDLPQSLFVPPPEGNYDAQAARGTLGVWLPELTADVLATYVFGPAYALHLAQTVQRPVAPLEVRAGTLAGRWLSQEPPALLRVEAACRALDSLGFTSEAAGLRQGFRAQHEAPDILLLPRADGSAIAVPESFMLAQLAPVLDDLLDEPQRALGEVTLLDVPGFAYLHGEHAEALEAAQRFLQGKPTVHDARVCGAGALLGALERPDLSALVLEALARSVRGAGTLEAVAQPEAGPGARGLPNFVRLSRNQHELRAALVLGAAFERPGTAARRFRRPR